MRRTCGDPREDAIRGAAVAYARISLEDTNVDLPPEAFTAVAEALNAAEGNVLVFCAAGLKRAPHLLYGVLRAQGNEPETAWARVAAARPMTERYEPYVESAERWVRASRDLLLDRPSQF